MLAARGPRRKAGSYARACRGRVAQATLPYSQLQGIPHPHGQGTYAVGDDSDACARQAHPEDVTGDACSLCGGTDEVAGDWISCDACAAWVHFSCDSRPGLGAFKDYARAGGEPYICGRCAQAPPAAGPARGAGGAGAPDDDDENDAAGSDDA